MVRIQKGILLFLNQNLCCGDSKEQSQWDGSFEHSKQMLKLIDKNIFTILRTSIVLISIYGLIFQYGCPYSFNYNKNSCKAVRW